MQAKQRRDVLLTQMKNLANEGKDCLKCPGHCCTAVANSMQVTPIEARDVLHYLREQGLWDEELRELMRATIDRFRLDQIPSNGKRQFLRRTYDCPFFKRQSLGCSLPPEVKPYGCLGFNPSTVGEIHGDSCRSDQGLLLTREELWNEEQKANEELRQYHHLWWEKLPLPLALLEAHTQGM